MANAEQWQGGGAAIGQLAGQPTGQGQHRQQIHGAGGRVAARGQAAAGAGPAQVEPQHRKTAGQQQPGQAGQGWAVTVAPQTMHQQHQRPRRCWRRREIQPGEQLPTSRQSDQQPFGPGPQRRWWQEGVPRGLQIGAIPGESLTERLDPQALQQRQLRTPSGTAPCDAAGGGEPASGFERHPSAQAAAFTLPTPIPRNSVSRPLITALASPKTMAVWGSSNRALAMPA